MATLTGERLYLNDYQLNDAQMISTYLSDPDITLNTETLPYPCNINDAESLIMQVHKLAQSNQKSYFAIRLKHHHEFIGSTSLRFINKNEAFIGYWLGKPHWKKGYSFEAVSLLCDYAFHQLKLDKLYAECLDYNIASAKLLEKLGFLFHQTIEKPHRNTKVKTFGVYNKLKT